jgi:hypothetical protein
MRTLAVTVLSLIVASTCAADSGSRSPWAVIATRACLMKLPLTARAWQGHLPKRGLLALPGVIHLNRGYEDMNVSFSVYPQGVLQDVLDVEFFHSRKAAAREYAKEIRLFRITQAQASRMFELNRNVVVLDGFPMHKASRAVINGCLRNEHGRG